MSIPPVSNINIAASIAGTDRAAGAEVASSHNKRGSGAGSPGAADPIVEQAEKVAKSDLSGDSDADGRQTLDSFERRHQDDTPEQPDHDDGQSPAQHSQHPNPGVTVNRPTLGGHIDLCG